MRQYAGIVIHRAQEGELEIDVVENRGYRSLHFDHMATQSRMSMKEPERLVLDYTQAMMCGLLMIPSAPKRILCIGLGGGSQVKFLHYHYPDCHIDAVEQSAVIADLATRYFQLPKSEHIHIHICDGEDYLRQHAFADEPRYDLILVDAYDSIGLSNQVEQSTFFHHCQQMLVENGVMAVNLWNDKAAQFSALCLMIEQQFERAPLHLPLLEDKENIVLFAINGLQPLAKKKPMRLAAKAFEQQTLLKLGPFIKRLYENNLT